jgi:ABC-type antimicrobial peptide transport system permease subunit
MQGYRAVRMAITALGRNPMRAMLTALGIIIGVGAVIAMMEIGAGSSSAIGKSISTMGANVLNLSPGAASSAGVSFGSSSRTTLTPENGEAILRECPAVRDVAPLVPTRAQVVFGNRNWVSAYIYGSISSYLGVQNWTIAEGESFTDRDVLNANRVCLLGQTLVRELFQGETPIGKNIRIKNVSFRVVGTLRGKGANMMGMDQDDIILAPWSAIKYRVKGSMLENPNQNATSASNSVNSLSNLYPGGQQDLYPERSAVQTADNPMPVRFAGGDHVLVAVQGADDIASAIDQITLLLRERHRIRPGEADDFRIRDMTEMTEALISTTNLMTNLLLCVYYVWL